VFPDKSALRNNLLQIGVEPWFPAPIYSGMMKPDPTPNQTVQTKAIEKFLADSRCYLLR